MIQEIRDHFYNYFLATVYLIAALPHPSDFYLIFKVIIFISIPWLIYARHDKLNTTLFAFLVIFWVVDNPLYVFKLSEYGWVIYNILAATFFLLVPSFKKL